MWFEEIPHHLEEIDEIVQKADLAIVVGTSSTVRSTEKNRQIGHHLMASPTRYTLLPATHMMSQRMGAQLPYSISTGVMAIARQITYS